MGSPFSAGGIPTIVELLFNASDTGGTYLDLHVDGAPVFKALPQHAELVIQVFMIFIKAKGLCHDPYLYRIGRIGVQDDLFYHLVIVALYGILRKGIAGAYTQSGH